ncbi:substrate-binding periplasmic protein [Desulforhopalus sp. 52FAK]
MGILPLCHMLADKLLNPTSRGKTVQLALGEYPPYYSKKIAQLGRIPETTTSIFAKQDMRVQYSWHPWTRAYELVKNGEYDGSFTNVKTQEREDEFYFSDPILQSDTLFFHLKKTFFRWHSIADLQGTTIGATLGSAYTPDFTEAGRKGEINIDWASDDILNFRKLFMEQIDIFPISKDVGLHKLKEHFSPSDIRKLTWSRTPLVSHSTYLIFSKKNPDNKQLMQLFNDGLQSVVTW